MIDKRFLAETNIKKIKKEQKAMEESALRVQDMARALDTAGFDLGLVEDLFDAPFIGDGRVVAVRLDLGDDFAGIMAVVGPFLVDCVTVSGGVFSFAPKKWAEAKEREYLVSHPSITVTPAAPVRLYFDGGRNGGRAKVECFAAIGGFLFDVEIPLTTRSSALLGATRIDKWESAGFFPGDEPRHAVVTALNLTPPFKELAMDGGPVKAVTTIWGKGTRDQHTHPASAHYPLADIPFDLAALPLPGTGHPEPVTIKGE